jgi:uncharacterized cupin superfamily protein
MEHGRHGKRPAGEGWFVVNAREAAWVRNERFGAGVTFEGDARFPQLGVNVQVLWPGQPNGYYHAEDAQEDFLILRGACTLLVEGQERRLRAWDFVHCPPHTAHIFVGAGDEPCVLLAVGARRPGDGIVYPVSGLALRHDAGVARETTDADVAYAAVPATTSGSYPEGTLPDG